VLIEWQIRIREVEFDCKRDQTIPRRKENKEGGPCLTALAAFASSDLSMTVSSEVEGAISCGGASTSSTIVAISFYFLCGKEIENVPRGCYGIHVICYLLVGDKARDFTMAAS
jgi:hypothetical protein